MSYDTKQLEQAWLKAETVADKVKSEAMQVDAVLAERCSGEIERDILELKSKAEHLRARVVEAERDAEAAFDRLWSAKELNGQNA